MGDASAAAMVPAFELAGDDVPVVLVLQNCWATALSTCHLSLWTFAVLSSSSSTSLERARLLRHCAASATSSAVACGSLSAFRHSFWRTAYASFQLPSCAVLRAAARC